MVEASLPNFLIIGAMKSGTTTICAELSRHPEIFFPESKEPNGLIRILNNEGKALQFYKQFYARKKQTVLGDASTGYSKFPSRPQAATLASELLGSELKILYITRDPIERLERHIAHDIQNGLQRDEIDLFSGAEYFAPSAYSMQLSFWRRKFPSENILRFDLADYVSRRNELIAEVCKFLKVDPRQMPKLPAVSANRSGQRRTAHRSKLKSIIHSPQYMALREVVPATLRRFAASLLLPKTAKLKVTLGSAERELVAKVLSDLNDLECPSADQVLEVIDFYRPKKRVIV